MQAESQSPDAEAHDSENYSGKNKDLVRMTTVEVMLHHDEFFHEAERRQKEAAEAVYSLQTNRRTFANLPDVLQFTTGDAVMDACFSGGLPASGIHEVFGASAVGKTQFCLQLALAAQIDHLHGGLEGGKDLLLQAETV